MCGSSQKQPGAGGAIGAPTTAEALVARGIASLERMRDVCGTAAAVTGASISRQPSATSAATTASVGGAGGWVVHVGGTGGLTKLIGS